MESSRNLCDSSSRSRSRHSLNSLNSRRRSSLLDSRSRNRSALVGRALTGDVARLSTLVADLTGGAERATVGSGTVTRNVTELTAGIALHSLSLTVTGEVVGATALVACCCAGVALETTAETALEAAAAGSGGASGSSGPGTGGGGVGAVALGLLGLWFAVCWKRGLTARWPGWLQL